MKILRILLPLFLLFSYIYANQEKANTIANLSALSLYNIDKISLQGTINTYLKDNPDIAGLKIVENLSNEIFYQMYKDDKKIIHNSPFPKTISQYKLFKTTSKYNNEVVGYIEVYFKEKTIKKINLTDEEKEWIKQHPVLKVGNEYDYAPWDFNKDGEPAGYSVDFLNLLGSKLGLKFEHELDTWDSLTKKLQEKKLDFLHTMYKNDTTRKNVIFSNPYKQIINALFVHENNNTIHSLNDLSGKTVSIPKGDSTIVSLKELDPKIKIIEPDGYIESIKDVTLQRADATIVELGVANYLINEFNIPNIKIVNEVEFKSKAIEYSYCFGVRDDYPLLVSILNKAMEHVTDEERKYLDNKWLNYSKNLNNVIKIELTKDEKKWLNNHSSVNVAVDPSWLPYEAINQDTKEYEGIVSEYLKHLEKSINIKFNIIKTKSWDESISKVKNTKEAEMFSAVKKTEEREKYLNFSNPLFMMEDVIITLYNSEYIGSISALKGKRVGIIKGYVTAERLQKDYPELNFIYVKNSLDGLKKVNDGKLDAYIDSLLVAGYLINKEGLYSLKIAAKTEYEQPLYIAVRKDVDPIFISIINKALKTITKDEQNSIFSKWISVNFEQKIDYSLIWKIAAALLVIIFGIFYWNRKLKQLVNEKTYELQELNQSLEFKVEERTEELNQNKLFLDTLLDSQEQIVITTDGEELRSVNKKFLDFFNISKIEEFKKDYDCICDRFRTDLDDNYLQKFIGKEKWIDYVIKNKDKTHKAIINKDGNDVIFTVTAATMPIENGKIKSAVFTDITILEKIREEIENIHKQTKSSIEYASLIQHALIPQDELFKKYFSDYLTIWKPKDIVGGDIYLFEELRNENECILMVIDCTGHGVPGAFVTMLVKAIERQIISNIINTKEEVSPAKILSIFNKSMKHLLKQENENSISNAGFDGGVLYYNKKDKIIKFAGAETALFYLEENEVKTIKGSRHSIGYKKSDANFEFKEHRIKVEDNMQFYLTTDGYLDQNGGKDSFPFGKRKFIKIIEENYKFTFNEQKELLMKSLIEYQGEEERNDDITVVGFKTK